MLHQGHMTVWRSACTVTLHLIIFSHYRRIWMTPEHANGSFCCVDVTVLFFFLSLFISQSSAIYFDCAIHIQAHRLSLKIPGPPTCSWRHPDASRAGQLVIHHRCLQSGWWGLWRRGGWRESTIGWGVWKKKRQKQSERNGEEIVNKGKRTAGTNKCFFVFFLMLWLATSSVSVCVWEGVQDSEKITSNFCFSMLNGCRAPPCMHINSVSCASLPV